MNIYDSLMDIFDQKKQRHLCRKKTFYDEKTKYYYITLPFNMVILAHLIRNTLPSITIILFHHTNSTFLSTKSLLINSTKLID